MHQRVTYIFLQRILMSLMLFSCLNTTVLKPRSILGELQIIHALELVWPHDDKHPHRFAWAPFTRYITLHTDESFRNPWYTGTAFAYEYRHPYGSIKALTSLGFERVKFNNAGNRFEKKRFGFDDIGFSFLFDVIRHNRNYFFLNAVVGFATTDPDPLEPAVGAGLNNYGGGMKLFFEIPGRLGRGLDLSFYGEGLVLQSSTATVLLNKKLRQISPKSSQKPFFKETFNAGTQFVNLLSLRSGPEEQGFEIGYHGSIFFNVHDVTKPLFSGPIPQRMESSMKKRKNLEKLTIHKNGDKASFVHHLYAQYNLVYETDWYPIGFCLGGSYSFGTDSWKGVIAWTSMSVHF